jgi:hypothetical protein
MDDVELGFPELLSALRPQSLCEGVSGGKWSDEAGNSDYASLGPRSIRVPRSIEGDAVAKLLKSLPQSVNADADPIDDGKG